ncbi:MAG: ABC transporter ATP-binding protein [Sulfitobacter sp.]
MNPLLSVEGIVSGYLNRPVLHGVSLEITKGSVSAVIGPNGHGKTTLLRSLSGLLTLREGSVTFDGVDISAATVHSRVERGIIHVPQGDQLFADMSVEENLLMGAYRHNDPVLTARKLDEVFAFFPKLKDRRRQVASSLSGGERRMVGIGRGLMADGKLMMIDEPSLGLAPLIIEQIYEGLAALRDIELSFLVVEENPSRLMDIADDLYLFDAGKIVWSGTPDAAKGSQDILRTYLGEGH